MKNTQCSLLLFRLEKMLESSSFYLQMNVCMRALSNYKRDMIKTLSININYREYLNYGN